MTTVTRSFQLAEQFGFELRRMGHEGEPVLTAKARTYDPVADIMPLDETRRRLAHIAGAVDKSADYMPTHKHFILNNCAAPELVAASKAAGPERAVRFG